jgi:hypothetical protein
VTGYFRDVDGTPRGGICLVDTNGTLLDDHFSSGGCGLYSYGGVTGAVISGIRFMADSMCYIWGAYHGYNDGTTNDPLQRFVTRLYGPDFSTGVSTTALPPSLTIWPVPTADQLSIGPLEKVRNLRVIDLQGRTVLEQAVNGQATATLQVAALEPGVYLLRANDGRLLGRFVKE